MDWTEPTFLQAILYGLKLGVGVTIGLLPIGLFFIALTHLMTKHL